MLLRLSNAYGFRRISFLRKLYTMLECMVFLPVLREPARDEIRYVFPRFERGQGGMRSRPLEIVEDGLNNQRAGLNAWEMKDEVVVHACGI